MLDTKLLNALRCPACEDRPKIQLHNPHWLHCQPCDRYFPIKKGVPRLLLEDAHRGPKAPPESPTDGEKV